MINRGFRLIFGVSSTLIILTFCISFNVSNPEGKIIEKKVSNGYEINEKGNYNEDKTVIENAIDNVIEDEMIKEIYELTNLYRREKGIKELNYDRDLSIAASIRAIEIARYNKFEHVRPNGLSYSSVLNDLNIKNRVNGENIAYGYTSSKEVSEAWKKSQGHYENIMNKKYGKIGIAYYKYNDTIYWVQIFTN